MNPSDSQGGSDCRFAKEDEHHEEEQCAQDFHDDDDDGVYESIIAMELRLEHEKLDSHKAILRMLLQRQERILENIQQRRTFQADCEDRIVHLRAQELEDKAMLEQ